MAQDLHRKIYEQNFGAIGFDPFTGETYHVHHRDGNHSNNDPSNLELLTRAEHIRRHNEEKVASGTHNFLGSTLNRQRIAAGTHNFVGGASNRKRIADGSYHMLQPDNPSKKRVDDGTHNFLGTNSPSHARVKKGTHNFQTPHACPHCGKQGRGPQMKRYHFDNCKVLVSP